MSESLKIGDYQLQLQRTSSVLAKNYGKQQLWRELKNIRNADPDNIVISAELHQAQWSNTAENMANEIVTYWDAMTAYMQTQQQQNNNNNNSNAMVSVVHQQEQDPPQLNEQAQDPPQLNEQAQEQAQDPQPEQESQQKEEENDETVPADNIPSEATPGWYGFDTTGNYLIDHQGTIVVDHRNAQDQRFDAKHRNTQYNQSKRRVLDHINKLHMNTRSITVLYSTNFERLGMPRNVATQSFSPILYQPQYCDIRMGLQNYFAWMADTFQERARLDSSSTNVNSESLQVFIHNFRNTIETSGNNDLLSAYDSGLISVFGVSRIEEVIAKLQESVQRARNANNNNAPEQQGQQEQQEQPEQSEQEQPEQEEEPQEAEE